MEKFEDPILEFNTRFGTIEISVKNRDYFLNDLSIYFYCENQDKDNAFLEGGIDIYIGNHIEVSQIFHYVLDLVSQLSECDFIYNDGIELQLVMRSKLKEKGLTISGEDILDF